MDNPFEIILSQLSEYNERLKSIEEALTKEKSIKRYSVQDIADNTPIGAQTIRNMIKKGTIKAEQFGNKYLITGEEFNRVCREVKTLKYKRE
jgi:excisionase family DNA binding protein